jgi:hypothetical protein
MNKICRRDMPIFRLLPLLAITAISCGPPIRTVGLFNSSGSEVTIQTYPQMTYNGSYEKYIDIFPDSSSRGRTWRVGDVNAIIVRPKGSYQQADTLAEYILSPASGFEIGHAFEKVVRPDDIKIKYLKIVTTRDTVVANGKEQIWRLLNYNKKRIRKNVIRYDRAIVLE